MGSIRGGRQLTVSVFNDLEDHSNAVQQCSLEAFDGRTFIQTEKLKAWFARDGARVERLLGLAYPDNASPGLPLRPIELCGEPSYLLVFSLLLQLGIGKCIRTFKYNGLHDEQLPISLNRVQETLERALASDHIDDLAIKAHAKLFYDKQHAYCPARFEYPHRREYAATVILPIVRKDIVSHKGTTAAIWQIVVPQEFVSSNLRMELHGSLFDHIEDNIGPRYRLAMKVFGSEKRTFYKTEREAFDNLFQHTGMLKCFGHFDQPDSDGKERYHLLLEYGQLDLDEYFIERTRPLFTDQIADFWGCICDVVVAISKLHEFESPREGISDVYNGCHADIKPDNILLVDGVFKLADPGLASFIKKDIQEKLRRRGEQVFVRGGTATFGAPECHMGNLWKGEVTNKIDVWSLGCVISLAATWVVLDKFGLLDYDRFRQEAIAKHIKQREPYEMAENVSQPQRYADWFHDGERVLPAIKEWHTYLRLASISEDSLTGKILDLVDGTMLCEEEKRLSAKDISIRMTSLISSYRAAYQQDRWPTFQDLPSSIKTFIDNQNQKAFRPGYAAPEAAESSVPSNLEPDETNPRKERKSELFQNTLLLYNSSSINKSSSRPSRISEEDEDNVGQSRDVRMQKRSVLPSTPTHRQRDSISSGSAPIVSPKWSGSSTANRSTISKPPSRQAAKTLFDLDFEDRTKKPRSVMSYLTSKKAHRAKNKDKELAQHFQNRRIHFLVDNGVSMLDVWSPTSTLLCRLVAFAVGQSPGGMDLTFTHGDWNLRGCEDVSKFAQMMEKAAPDEGLSRGGDISTGLNKILKPYVKSAHDMKDLVVVILTDGKWDGMRNKSSVGDTLVEFYNNLKSRVRHSIDKQVGFSFVNMGDDEEAAKRLEYLDMHLAAERGIPDMIDTTHWIRDVRKMLLGSFVDSWDIVDEAEELELDPDPDLNPEPELTPGMNDIRHHRKHPVRTPKGP